MLDTDLHLPAGRARRVELHEYDAVDGQKVLRGAISASGETVTIDDGRPHEVTFSNIESAHLVFEFGPAPKPGGKNQRKK